MHANETKWDFRETHPASINLKEGIRWHFWNPVIQLVKVACLYFYLTSILSGHVTCLIYSTCVWKSVHAQCEVICDLCENNCLLATQKLKLWPHNKWPVFSTNFLYKKVVIVEIQTAYEPGQHMNIQCLCTVEQYTCSKLVLIQPHVLFLTAQYVFERITQRWSLMMMNSSMYSVQF